MATQNLIDEKHITNALVYIEGKELEIVSLNLDQAFGQHHKFVVVLDYDVMKKSFLGSPLEQIALIGKQLDIDLQQGDDSGNAYEFRGVIDNVYNEGQEGKHGYLVIEGSSTTILLERGKRLDIFANMTLQMVFEEVTDSIKNNTLSKVNKPAHDAPINFLMQYYESDWEFLQRISAISGETLFYTGMDLVFGQYKDWEAMEVMYDREITNIRFGSRLLPNTFTKYQYLASKDDTIKQESPDTIENSNEFIDMAAQRAKDLVTDRPVLLPSCMAVEDKGVLDEMVMRSKTQNAARTIYIEGKAKTCAPRIGRLLKILMPEAMSESSELGTYRIVRVKHTIDQNHRYSCEFEAIPASLKFFPVADVKMPVANSVRATVIKNDDPDKQGRVKVEFPFAQDRVSDTWLRVMTPDAGGLAGYGNKKTGIVEKNRGMVFIPEEGDQVMVGFEFGDPNLPYVMGSMFHGKNTEGGGTDNNIKSIITKSGHTIEFDDADDTANITIKDANGNVIRLDTKNQNIEITASETITLTAKNIRMEASENIEMRAEAAIKADAMAEIHIGAQSNVDIATEADIQIKSVGSTDITAKTDIKIEGQSAKVTSASNMEISGKDTDIKGQSTKVSGASHKIEIV